MIQGASCRSTAAGPSIVDAEVAKFGDVAAEWWDPRGTFRPLHALNPVRVAFIRDALCAGFGRGPIGSQPAVFCSRLLCLLCSSAFLKEASSDVFE